MDEMIVRFASAGLDIKAGEEYTGGGERYISAVRRFYESYDKNRMQLEKYYVSEDYENYKITVHALKSNAKAIGAGQLSFAFEELEMAATEGNIAYVKEKHGKALFSYSSVIKSLVFVKEMWDVRPADELSAKQARAVSEELLAALDDYDFDRSTELSKKLSGYPFRITQSGRLKEAMNLIADFMYDEAAEIIKEISAAIE